MKPLSITEYTSDWDTVTPSEGDSDKFDTSRLKWTLPLLAGSTTAATAAALLSNEIVLAVSAVAVVAILARVIYDIFITTRKSPYTGPRLYRNDLCSTTQKTEILDACIGSAVDIHRRASSSDYMSSLVSDNDLHNSVWQCAVALEENSSESLEYARLIQKRLEESERNLIEADAQFQIDTSPQQPELREVEKYSNDASLSLLYGSISLRKGAEEVSLRRDDER